MVVSYVAIIAWLYWVSIHITTMPSVFICQYESWSEFWNIILYSIFTQQMLKGYFNQLSYFNTKYITLNYEIPLLAGVRLYSTVGTMQAQM